MKLKPGVIEFLKSPAADQLARDMEESLRVMDEMAADAAKAPQTIRMWISDEDADRLLAMGRTA